MRVEQVRLEDFRNYDRLEVELSPGLNLVVGRNAQGKTNLLEALYCLGGLGSPRSPDGALVREGAERAFVHARVVKGSRAVVVDIELRPGKGMRALINRTAVSGARELSEVTTAVFFGPDELSLIKGSPDGRRRFVDDLVVKLRPARDGLRREWERVLRQRNALLKTMPRGAGVGSGSSTLEVWDESLCRVGAAVAAARLNALGRLAPYAGRRYAEISGGGRLELGYESAWIEKDASEQALTHPGAVDESLLHKALAAALEEVRVRELERGVSLVGPQRDDVSVGVGSADGSGDGRFLDARSFASQGDQRTAALGLKLAESDLLAEALGARPVLLLDDVFSELDPGRRSWLSSSVRELGQVFISSAEPGAIAAAKADRVLEVVRGRVEVRE